MYKHVIKSKGHIVSFITNTHNFLYAIKFYPNICFLFLKDKNYIKKYDYSICEILPMNHRDSVLPSIDSRERLHCFIRLPSIVSNETFSRRQRER